jgi:hypothetical protein
MKWPGRLAQFPDRVTVQVAHWAGIVLHFFARDIGQSVLKCLVVHIEEEQHGDCIEANSNGAPAHELRALVGGTQVSNLAATTHARVADKRAIIAHCICVWLFIRAGKEGGGFNHHDDFWNSDDHEG